MDTFILLTITGLGLGAMYFLIASGLAPLLVADVARALEAAREHTTVLLVEQNLGVVRRLAERVVVLDQGRVVHRSDAKELLEQPDLVKRLLSVGHA